MSRPTHTSFVSQWFFGPNVTERIVVATGARCLVNAIEVDPEMCYKHTVFTGTSHPELYASLPEIVQSMGQTRGLYAGWHGGHDVSGHTFILVLSLLLLSEMLIPYLPYVLPDFSFLRQSIPRALYSDRDVFHRVPYLDRVANWAVLAVSVALVGLWSSMLLVTSVYFHAPEEKLSGFLAALAVWALMPKATALVS